MNTLNDFDMTILYLAAGIFLLMGCLSLLTSKEAFRGLGRVATGLGLGLLGYYIYILVPAVFMATGYASAQQSLSIGLMGIGVLTIASGVRKFKRRNLESDK